MGHSESLVRSAWSVYASLDLFGEFLGTLLIPFVSARFSRPRYIVDRCENVDRALTKTKHSRGILVGAWCFVVPGRLLQGLAGLAGLSSLLVLGKLVGSIGTGIVEVRTVQRPQ